MCDDMAVNSFRQLLLNGSVVENNTSNVRWEKINVTISVASENGMNDPVNARIEESGVEDVFMVSMKSFSITSSTITCYKAQESSLGEVGSITANLEEHLVLAFEAPLNTAVQGTEGDTGVDPSIKIFLDVSRENDIS